MTLMTGGDGFIGGGRDWSQAAAAWLDGLDDVSSSPSNSTAAFGAPPCHASHARRWPHTKAASQACAASRGLTHGAARDTLMRLASRSAPLHTTHTALPPHTSDARMARRQLA